MTAPLPSRAGASSSWFAIALLLLVAGPVRGGAQAPLSLRVGGSEAHSFTGAQLSAMAKDTLRAALPKGDGRAYRVIPLYDLLLRANVRIDSVRGPKSTLVVLVTGADGYRAAFTLAEIAGDVGPSRVYLATGTTSGPLPVEDGPYRLVVPTDRRQGRWVRQVVALDIVDAQPPRD